MAANLNPVYESAGLRGNRAMTLRHDRQQPVTSTLLAAAANGVVPMIERHGGDVDAIFGRAGLDIDDIASPFNELNLMRYCALFEEAARVTGNDNFGLYFGQDFAPRRLGAIGYVAINSPTLAAGLRNLVHYFPAHQDDSILTVEEAQDVLWLHYQIVHPRILGRRQDAELSLGMFCNIFRHALGKDWRPLKVRFEHGPPDGRSEHEACFGAPVEFGRPTNAIAVRRGDLDAVMPDSDPHLLSVIEPVLAERRQLRGSPEDLPARLGARIRLSLGEATPSLRQVAEELGMSPWSLQRRLRANGVSFQDVVRGSRRELALRHVGGSDVPLTEIALALGYSEQSAFSRAFRSWTGMSPRTYRRLVRRNRAAPTP